MLDASLTGQLTSHLTNLRQPIELVASLDDGPKSVELRGLLDEIAACSALISVRDASAAVDDLDAFDADGSPVRRPSFAIRRVGTEVAVRFAGIPLGHEFTSLVLALLHVGGHPPRISEETAAEVASLEVEAHFETFFSLTCQNCPDVVQALNIMSVLNPRITHTAIDGALFQAEADARQVMAVPTVFVNGELFDSGRMTVEQILAKLDAGAAEREAAKIDAKEPFDVLVVGGGPAGATAAIYAARKGIRTGVVAERFGGQVLDTMAIENFVSVPYTEGPKLGAALEAHVRDYEVDIMNLQRAEGLSLDADGLVKVSLASGAALRSRTVVLATGARWRQMGVPGEADYRNKGVTYCPHCDGPLFKGKRVAVIGGGNSGIEAAIDLAGVVAHVTVLEFDPQLRADEVLQAKLRSLPNVTVIVNAHTTEVTGDGRALGGLIYTDRVSDTSHTIALEGVFVQIGLLPSTDWLRDSAVELSPRGEIVIDERGATSMPSVFAAGDCTTVPYKQIVIAMGAGSIAALSAFDHLIRTPAP
jgi:alkyl hydroperoxide reductase subunit F